MSSILNSVLSGDIHKQCTHINPKKEDSIIDILENSTGFGELNDLHYKDSCSKPKLKMPLYKENFLSEFVTKEEKEAARRSLGFYDEEDIVSKSLLSAENLLPSLSELKTAPIKQLRKGDKFFVPITTFNAVVNSDGISLKENLQEIENNVLKNQKEIANIIKPSGLNQVTSLGDVRLFLRNFNTTNSLKDVLDAMDQNMLRFEKTGQIL